MFVLVALVAWAVAAFAARIPCTNHPSGYCVNIYQEYCPAGTESSDSGCGYNEKCCYVPDPASGVAGTNAQCGVPDYNPPFKIVGGTQTVIEKYPWQVSIQYRDYHTCGGTIISDRWVLTAAHCILERQQPIAINQFTVVAGSTNQESFSFVANYYTSVQIITHPQYLKNVRNDLALIKVNKAFDFTGRLKKPICLPNSGEVFTGQNCVATGWGATTGVEALQHSMMYLREVNLPIVSRTTCQYYVGSLDSNNICAGLTTGGIDTCQGDSGGPLVCKNSQGVWKQAGIVSYGRGCAEAHTFGVYTEVAKFKSWIQDVISRY
ncbi:hypothetical protein BsWGS_17265 [Bradybaena similaris]